MIRRSAVARSAVLSAASVLVVGCIAGCAGPTGGGPSPDEQIATYKTYGSSGGMQALNAGTLILDDECLYTGSSTYETDGEPLTLVIFPEEFTTWDGTTLTVGLLPAPAHPRLAALVILDRDPYLIGAAQLELLDLADAIPLLVPETSALPALENGIPIIARLAAAIGGVHRVRYRDAEQLVPITAGLLATPPAQEDRWSEIPGRNAVTDGQRVIVLAAGTVHVLDGIAATIWHHPHLHGDALTMAVTAQHGHADDAPKRVRDAAAHLVAIGLHAEA